MIDKGLEVCSDITMQSKRAFCCELQYSRTSLSGHSEKRTHSLERTKI